jgi:hypothetical protein
LGLGILTDTALAGVPSTLLESTSRFGFYLAAGEAAAIAAPVVALSEGVMKVMFLTKLKVVTSAVVIGCAVLATSAAGW